MNRSTKWLVVVLLILTVASITGMALMAAHRADPQDKDDAAASAPSPTAPANGTVTIDAQAQRREGIRVLAVKRATMHAQVQGFAVVLGVADLVNARNSYVAAAQTQLNRDRVNLDTARIEYQRVKKLYDEDQNMSLKATQDADTAYRNAQARMATDLQDARLQLDVVRQRWGPAVTSWIESNSSVLESVLEQRDSLVQVTFPPEIAEPPRTITLELPGHHVDEARFVSALPQVNTQIQSPNFLYLAPQRAGLAVGANLVALVPVGRLSRGTVVPESAIVWWQGAAWVYQQTSSGTFARRAVPTDNPVDGGYFVSAGAIPLESKLVTTGASALLSQELLVHSQGDQGDSDDDDD
jgi:hypothetical protein